MTMVTTEDRIEIAVREQGGGPAVVIVPHWSGHPTVFEPLIAALAADHRVVTYDARGTGDSTPTGPYDLATAGRDLGAVAAAVGGASVAIAIAEGGNVAVRAAAEHPDLVGEVVIPGGAPLPRRLLRDRETGGMVISDTVLEAFYSMLETDYRGGMRSIISATNPQMTQDELRGRVVEQVAYCPGEVAVARLRAWAADDVLAEAKSLGERLHFVHFPSLSSPWWPSIEDLIALMAEHLPEANRVEVADGPVSRPDLTAAIVREIAVARSEAA